MLLLTVAWLTSKPTLFDAVWGNGRWFSSVSPCFNCENQRIDRSFMPCLWSRVKRLTSMASTSLQQLGCCNSHLSSSPKSLSGLLQFERQEPKKRLLFFLLIGEGAKSGCWEIYRNFLVPSSLQVMSNFAWEFAEIPKAQAKRTSKSNSKFNIYIYYHKKSKGIMYTAMKFPKKSSNNPHINSYKPIGTVRTVTPWGWPGQPESRPRWLHRANSHPGHKGKPRKKTLCFFMGSL